MTRLLTLLAVCLLPAATHAATDITTDAPPTRSEQRAERHRLDGKENNIFLTGSLGCTHFNQLIYQVRLEYNRQIRGNFFWGCGVSMNKHLGSRFQYDFDGGGNPYRNTIAQDIFKLDGMAYYRMPVVRSRLFFRLGAGFGLGYHQILNRRDNPKLDDKILPYFNFEAAWILRLACNFEMKFSPTIILLPSQFSISPVQLGKPTNVTPWITDLMGFSLSMGWRF